ncbi:MAG TPA: hypothetical protein VG125_25705 [Pirellulales bacterium]|nr:hypothetical protein [Pirellulales bacterium]
MILHERIAHRLSWPVGLGLLLIAVPMVLWVPVVRQAKADVDATEGQFRASVDELQLRVSRLEETVALLVNELRELQAKLEPSREQALTNDEVGPVQESATEEQMQTDDGEQVLENDETAPPLDSEVAEQMEPEESEHEANESDENEVPNNDAEHQDDSEDRGSGQASEANDEVPQPRLAELIREHKRLRQRLIEIEDELEEELGRRLEQ